MTAATADTERRINAFHDKHGHAWGIVEFAGWDEERHTGALFESASEAWAYANKHYDPDEIESLGVDVAHWDRDAQFWSYDH